MISKEQLARINELSKKSKESGLSDAEKTEQKQLREEYLKAFRSSMKNTLKTVKIVDPEGNDVTPEKLKREKDQNLH
ncbi:DUF896 domain-containing protein [Bacillus safensis]|uniref:DUF896 domain-containing protein n=1 Tax=Bacillus safensis TaxID=561879 RepID=UPI000B44143F|nr:DUF896 domain-containing protein [Bacillus safensis]MCY7493435.1 DUF896 domain-containing protein [Bacillus safensis]MED4992239.1 DUF896 domain-containing protein [Bacillus safensis]UDB47834.1 DUF896 domain-containing protein [Bacillus safensis]